LLQIRTDGLRARAGHAPGGSAFGAFARWRERPPASPTSGSGASAPDTPPLPRGGVTIRDAPEGEDYLAARAGSRSARAGAPFFAARSSSQIVIGAAMNQVEYVPEMMPIIMAAEKSKMVPTP
jgi:hypothetical protein